MALDRNKPECWSLWRDNDNTYVDLSYNVNKCDVEYMFLFSATSLVIYK
jgi:hypothetical protein